MKIIYISSLSTSRNEQNALNKAECNNLFIKLEQIEKECKHYKKLKKRWNLVKNVLHYGKYGVSGVLIGLDIGVFFVPVVGPFLSAGGITLTIGETVSMNLFEDMVANSKVNKYTKKIEFLDKHINSMHIFKVDALKDGMVDEHELQLWKRLVDEYEASLKELKKDLKKSEENMDIKKMFEEWKQMKNQQRN